MANVSNMLSKTEKPLRQVTAFATVTAVLGHHTPHIPELCITSKRSISNLTPLTEFSAEKNENFWHLFNPINRLL
jgi:hypothetical protein